MFAAVFTYSMLSGFVLSSASRNRRDGRSNPAMVEYVGYALIGVSVALVLALLYLTAMGMELPVE
jgi:hypothetical protein